MPRLAAPVWITLAVIVGLLLRLFYPTFIWMHERFSAYDSFYQHGWLIPFACAWLIWQKREALAVIPLKADLRGLILLIPAMFLHLVALRLQVGFVSGFAFVFTVWGLFWTCLGFKVLKTCRFATLFLLFMVPLPSILLITASFKMKLFAATLATHVLQFIGMEAVRAGSTIHVPGISVIVDDTCSGLRSLISLITLAILWIALLPKNTSMAKKWILVVCAVPIALFANIVRIVVLVILSAVYGPGVAESFIHGGSGFVVFIVALIALTALSRLLVGEQVDD